MKVTMLMIEQYIFKPRQTIFFETVYYILKYIYFDIVERSLAMGPSIYDVHTEGVDACGQGGVQPHVDVHTEN